MERGSGDRRRERGGGVRTSFSGFQGEPNSRRNQNQAGKGKERKDRRGHYKVQRVSGGNTFGAQKQKRQGDQQKEKEEKRGRPEQGSAASEGTTFGAQTKTGRQRKGRERGRCKKEAGGGGDEFGRRI